MILKTHTHSDGRLIVCITDDNLIGKVIEEGNKQLDCSSSFFNGQRASEEEIKSYLSKAAMLILNGKESVTFAQNNGIDIVKIQEIKGVPFAQVLQ